MGKRIFTDQDYATIAEMREKGKSYRQIAAKFGCSDKAISWHCLRLCVDPPKPRPLRLNYHLEQPVMKRGNHIVRAFTPDEDRKIVELDLAGKTTTEIGRALGRKWNSVKGRMMTLARRDERAAV